VTELDDRPLVALTLGDVAGIGPEVVALAWSLPTLHALAKPFVVGDSTILRRALDRVRSTGNASSIQVETIDAPEAARPSPTVIPCLEVAGVDVAGVRPGLVDARAGAAAARWLVEGIDLALAGRIDAIVTLPLHKESLHLAGVPHPGHTEILAERCGVAEHAMMLYLPPDDAGPGGLGVIHATLHVALRDVFDLLTLDSVASKIHLADSAIRPLTDGRQPRIAVAGLNPHAGENGLFGDEEIRIIAPAVAQCQREGVDVVGPIAADTLFGRALGGEFDAVLAMYHDQGHVALKTIGFDRAVNVTLGLPIVRTSVAHGTAFDIAWQGRDVDTSSLIAAVRVAVRIVADNVRIKRIEPRMEHG